MVLVPAGSFWMGCTPDDRFCRWELQLLNDNEKPAHQVTLDAFYIDRTEVTVADYRRCVAAGRCGAPADIGVPDMDTLCNWNKKGRDRHPINCVDHEQATAYCAWVGKRLPTEAEWEKSARGIDGRIFPWGNAEPADLGPQGPLCCDAPDSGTCPVGSHLSGASPYGALDLSGNVSEWIADWYADYGPTPSSNPHGPRRGDTHVVRGGGWAFGGFDGQRAAARGGDEPGDRSPVLGFRCARSAPEKALRQGEQGNPQAAGPGETCADACREEGRCRRVGAECVVGSSADCKASHACTGWGGGACSAVTVGGDLRCVPTSDADCQLSADCSQSGFCLFQPPSPPGCHYVKEVSSDLCSKTPHCVGSR